MLVILGVQFSILPHLLDLILGEAAAGGDGDLLFFAGAKVLGADVQNAVGVDIKSHFNLRHAARRGRNVGELEFADRLVVARELAFALQNMDFNSRLVIGRGRKYF